MSLPALVAMGDDLYRSVVMDPERWNEQAFSDWLESAAAVAVPSSREARAVRRTVRMAMKLAAFWSSPQADRHRPEPDWQARVDLAVGPAAWRPTLDLALAAIDRAPSPELFEHVANRFRSTTGEPFAGGAGYEEWLAGADAP